ncbi:MAG: AbrB/MazE/SpoVT family DNA-binding domain-containing protein [Candidatus Omnitrophota bacterium]|nr:AbrB/MazE/SpoVT family DNA-binding domain-containing protein [Candidatus Omnitrophota bacterium]
MQLALIRPIGRRNQITIPPQLLKRFGLHPGDLVNFRQEREGILMKPVEVVERKEAWTKEDLEDMERTFEKQKEKKEYIRFSDSDSALKHLRKIMKKK